MIRKATSADKKPVLEFCKNTFSWGDYIQDVWDYWLSEGIFLVAEKLTPVGICHAVFSKGQVWIEGIRVNPDFRREGIASKLVRKVESISKEKQIKLSFMLIDTKNQPSLEMAKILNYKIFQTWNFYSLTPKPNINYHISFGAINSENQIEHYVKSWRWVPLDHQKLNFLNSNNYIIYAGTDDNKTIAILEDSEHFKNTLIVSLYAGTENNTKNVISFLQNYGFEKHYQRLQILTKEFLPDFKGLDFRISFHLMQKLLS